MTKEHHSKLTSRPFHTKKRSKQWKVKTADNKFSQCIRERDKDCVRSQEANCGGKLECSHFFTRNISATRYDQFNADTLCHYHHTNIYIGWEYRKQSDYRNWKIAQLGKIKFAKLEERAKIIMKRAVAIKEFQKFIQEGGIFEKFERKRTDRQNRALHLYYQWVADALNDAGLDIRAVLKPEVDIPWSKNTVKEFMWRPVQELLLSKKSTTELKKNKDIDEVFDVMNRHLAKFGIIVPFPDVTNINTDL